MLAEEQQLLQIPFFNNLTVYSAYQLEQEIGPVLKSLGGRLQDIYNRRLDVAADVVLGIPLTMYELVRVTRQAANLEISVDLVPLVKVTLSCMFHCAC